MTQQIDPVQEISKNLKTKKLVLGTARILKLLGRGGLLKVYLSSNIPSKVEEDINIYSKLAGVEMVKLDVSNHELGILCKKPFHISVVGLLK